MAAKEIAKVRILLTAILGAVFYREAENMCQGHGELLQALSFADQLHGFCVACAKNSFPYPYANDSVYNLVPDLTPEYCS